MLINNLTFSALEIKARMGKGQKHEYFYISALTAPHKYGYGEYPVASPDMVSLGDISINMQGYARYPLVKAHGKETVPEFLIKFWYFSMCALCTVHIYTE